MCLSPGHHGVRTKQSPSTLCVLLAPSFPDPSCRTAGGEGGGEAARIQTSPPRLRGGGSSTDSLALQHRSRLLQPPLLLLSCASTLEPGIHGLWMHTSCRHTQALCVPPCRHTPTPYKVASFHTQAYISRTLYVPPCTQINPGVWNLAGRWAQYTPNPGSNLFIDMIYYIELLTRFDGGYIHQGCWSWGYIYNNK